MVRLDVPWIHAKQDGITQGDVDRILASATFFVGERLIAPEGYYNATIRGVVVNVNPDCAGVVYLVRHDDGDECHMTEDMIRNGYRLVVH